MLDAIQTFISAYTTQRFRQTVAQKVSVASCELLENAINYGSITGEIVYELWMSDSHLEVRVANHAVHARITMLNERVSKLKANAEEVYMEEMRRSVAGGLPRAMLGLARISHEAEMALDLQVSGNRVTVTARCKR